MSGRCQPNDFSKLRTETVGLTHDSNAVPIATDSGYDHDAASLSALWFCPLTGEVTHTPASAQATTDVQNQAKGRDEDVSDVRRIPRAPLVACPFPLA
jgi:hypothetical protein